MLDKLEIIESLMQDLGKGLTTYLATTLDKPSTMWREGASFFELQDQIISGMKDKRRIVVLTPGKLKEEIEDASDAMERFIEWHENSQRNFGLVFLIDSENMFVTKTRQSIRDIKAHHVVTDFAIMGDKWVYGEVAESSDAPSENKSLRLYEAKPMGLIPATVVDEYKKFYEALWNRWEGYTWPIMSPKQILSERARFKAKQTYRSKLNDHYTALIGTNTSAPNCFNTVKDILNSSKQDDKIVAVDIAPLKSSGLLAWISAAEYVEWLTATCNAAGNKCDLKRAYILNARLGNRADAQEAYDKIFAPQLEVGVDVYLLAARDLWTQGIPMHDFLLIQNRLCMSLTWEESFSRESFNAESHLEHPATFGWYENVFNNIVASPAAKRLLAIDSSVRREETLKYLATHQW